MIEKIDKIRDLLIVPSVDEQPKMAINQMKILNLLVELRAEAEQLHIKTNKMNKTIYKYPLEVTDFQEVLLPIGAEILTIQTQGGKVCMWALVNPNETQKEARNIEIFGTGHPIGYDMGISRKYISSFQIHGGQLVFHAFEYTGV